MVYLMVYFDGVFSTTSARKKKNSNKSVDGSTVALMILVIFNRLFEHLKLYRFTTIEWCQSNTSNWMGKTNRNSTAPFGYRYERLTGKFFKYMTVYITCNIHCIQYLTYWNIHNVTYCMLYTVCFINVSILKSQLGMVFWWITNYKSSTFIKWFAILDLEFIDFPWFSKNG